MLRTIATARLILGPAMNVQAPPNLMPADHQEYLRAGINDWGGVSPVTLDHINPERAWPAIADLRQVTEEEGFELRERLCVYPEHVRSPERLPTLLRDRIEAYVDETGLVRRELTVAN
jgi:FO synthase